jgi:hypothetical protein
MHISFELSFIILIIAMLVQSFHMVEHIAQIVEKFVLNHPQAHGVLGKSLDFEPVHFVYNLSYLTLVAIAWIGFRKIHIKKMQMAFWLITFVLIFQSWHFIEHAVKLEQHFIEGCISCQGILGRVTNVMILHFIYNLVAFIPLVIAYMIIQDNIPRIKRDLEIYKK